MLDTMNVLVNKLSLQISRAAEGDMSILDSVRHLLHEQICDGLKFASRGRLLPAEASSVRRTT